MKSRNRFNNAITDHENYELHADDDDNIAVPPIRTHRPSKNSCGRDP